MSLSSDPNYPHAKFLSTGYIYSLLTCPGIWRTLPASSAMLTACHLSLQSLNCTRPFSPQGLCTCCSLYLAYLCHQPSPSTNTSLVNSVSRFKGSFNWSSLSPGIDQIPLTTLPGLCIFPTSSPRMISAFACDICP